LLPGRFYRFGFGHSGHPASGLEVGNLNDLSGLRQDRGAFGHEVHTAKHYVAAIPVLCGFSGQLERIPNEIAQFNDFFSLVMVCQNYQLFAEFAFSGTD
jgi:hypothetical protein